MATRPRCNTIDPKHLPAAVRKQLAHELYAVQQCIFADTGEADFAAFLLDRRAKRNRVRVFRNVSRRIVGYQGVHLFETRTDTGQSIAVFRAEAGLLRPYRRHHLTLQLALWEFVRYRLLHPCRKTYYLGSFVHPSSYHLVCRHCRELYPSYRQETPPEVLKLMLALADQFALERPDPAHPLLVWESWQVRELATDRARWARSTSPDIRFFLQMNPYYDQGQGLLTLIPLNHRNLLRGLCGYLGDLLAHPCKPGPNDMKH